MAKTVTTSDAPEAVGPYSQAKTDGNLVFTAGQLPMTPDGDLLANEPIGVQTEQSLANIKAILAEAGLDMSDVLKVTVFLDDIDDFASMNEVYAEFFGDEPPARSAFEVAGLPKGAGVEIEAIATQN